MQSHDWVLLTKVPDLIMRGALIVKLGESQIEVYAPDRDAIVNVGTGPNLSLEGYSALFDGYYVYVPRKDLREAQQVWADFQNVVWPADREKPPVDHAAKFYFAAVMSWMLPGPKRSSSRSRSSRVTASRVRWLRR